MSTHETFERDNQIQGGTDRNFGFVFAGFFFLVAVYPVVRHRPVRWWAYAVSGCFLLAALIAPKVLGPLNWLWTRIGYALSRVTNVILLSFLFYGLFSALGWFMRLRGRDPLRRRFDRSLETYWIPREPPGPEPRSLLKQF